MSSFSRFLKELPFVPKYFRTKQDSEDRSSGGAGLAGITINVYELELNDDSTEQSRDTDSDQATTICPSPRPDYHFIDHVMSSTATSRLGITSVQKLRYTNLVVFCRKCKNETSVRYLFQHKRRHEALDILKYSPDFPPKTMRGLLRRRNKIMTDLVEDNDLDQAQVFYLLNKVNIAFEVLKCEVEGTIEHVVNSSRWRERDIRTEGKTFSFGFLLGISKYRSPDSTGFSIIKTVHIDNFLENQGLFLGMYQGYNGNYVANLCARELHKEIKERLHYFSDTLDNSEKVKFAFQVAYRKIDKLQLDGEGEHPCKRWSGCSAITCLLLSDVLYVANEGNVKGILIRENNTIRAITSSHDLYNRKERQRVRRNCGLVVKSERCALVNGILNTTRGLGNQGDWRLKICVINRPTFRVVNLKPTDKMLVLASEGMWKIFSHNDVVFLLSKFLRDASCKRHYSEESLLKAKTPEGQGFLNIPSVHVDAEYRAYLRKQNVNPIDSRVSQFVSWDPDNPTIVIRRPTIVKEEPLLEENKDTSISKKCYFTDSEQDDEDLQEMSKLLNHYNTKSSYTRREIARLLSKRLIKSGLIAGVETDNVAIIVLLNGFDLDDYKYNYT